MPFLNTFANQQADLLMSDALQFEEVIRRSLIKTGEFDIPLQVDPSIQESRDAYNIPALETLTDRLAALQHTLDALIAQKINLQEIINNYNHYVAMHAQNAEDNNETSDERKDYLERNLTANFHSEQNEGHLRELEELNRNIEEVEEQITAQENAIKEHHAIEGENEQEDTIMTGVECLVCFENVADTMTLKLCQHTICTTCAHTYIFTTKQMKLPASCPAEADCSGQLDLEQLSDHLAAEDLDKLHRHALETQLIESGEAFFCSNPRCCEVLELNEDTEIGVECPSCFTRLCSSCKVAWHNGLTCEEYQGLPEAERSEADLTLLNLARAEEWKRCPRCRTMISLTTGCNHMTCRCSYEFCYICLAEWVKETGCPTRCPLWDENRIVDRPIPDAPIAGQPFVPAARARIPPRQDRLFNPPRGINLADLDIGRTAGLLRRSLIDLECMYCQRRFAQLSALNKHLNYTQQHDVFACCGKVFLNEERLQRHAYATHN